MDGLTLIEWEYASDELFPLWFARAFGPALHDGAKLHGSGNGNLLRSSENEGAAGEQQSRGNFILGGG